MHYLKSHHLCPLYYLKNNLYPKYIYKIGYDFYDDFFIIKLISWFFNKESFSIEFLTKIRLGMVSDCINSIFLLQEIKITNIKKNIFFIIVFF